MTGGNNALHFENTDTFRQKIQIIGTFKKESIKINKHKRKNSWSSKKINVKLHKNDRR